MNVLLSQRAIAALAAAPVPVQRAFIKQINFLVRDLRHPGLHAKKYDESEDRWQARVNDDWRFYFRIDGNVYRILDLIPHPK
jgi:plasmid maintenance system killer protein